MHCRKLLRYVELKVFKEVTIKDNTFWDVTPYEFRKNVASEGSIATLFRVKKLKRRKTLAVGYQPEIQFEGTLLANCYRISSLFYPETEATRSPETSVFTRPKLRYTPEDGFCTETCSDILRMKNVKVFANIILALNFPYTE
jgi:hypothetical protein